ncbi:transcriptional regulator [Macrococcoides caseolyticum]|uniref:helix-turn-helix domain-containing protein n=1 Tax=Macrococcoides caseolyticum TaxID=69966 RepID=UPI000C321844|nr:helix-turn-helix transcriptional regulator [Macrococcus caseolyticus]PKE36373.1 transcriptional regulator [Macrococcus caseolyticus]PKE74930.1 transcriptional regulator [Macrococcus caseolyticus]
MESESVRKTLSANLQKLMQQNNVDQKELAEALNVSQPTVSNWINQTKYPRIKRIQEIADYFNVPKSKIIEPWDSVDKNKNSIDIVKNLEEQGIIINFADYEGFEKLSDEEKLEFQKKIEEAVQFELFKRNQAK